MRKFMKNKKLMAWVVLLTFLFSCVMPTNLSAGNSLAEAAETLTNASQVVKDNFDAFGDPEVVTAENGKVKISKTLTPNGVENEFNVTLQVETTEDLKAIPTTNDAAVVLILDKSGSMNWCTEEEHQHSEQHGCYSLNCNKYHDRPGHDRGCYKLVCTKEEHEHTNNGYSGCGGNNSRFVQAKAAINTFVENYYNSATLNADGTKAKRLISVIEFSDSASVNNFGDRRNSSNWSDIATERNASAAKTKVNSVLPDSASGATNIDDALYDAKDVIDDGKANGTLNGINNVVVILLTDGKPTVNRDSNHEGSTANEGDYTKAEAKATTLRNTIVNGSNVALYSIAFATTDTFSHKTHGTITVYDWLSSISDIAYHAGEQVDLTKIFSVINKLIEIGPQAWQVNDPMGTNIVYTGDTLGTSTDNNHDGNREGNQYSFANGVLDWNLHASERTVTTTGTGENQHTTYKYTLTYPIRLDNTTKGFAFDTAVETNGVTTLKYFLKEQVTADSDVTSILKTATFANPAVQGYKGDLVFDKIDSLTKEALNGAEFTLTSTCDATHGHAKYEATATSANGKVKFENIPSGHTYTLSETKMVGYQELADQNVTVSYGEVTGADGKTIEAIANVPNKIDISGVKTWDDNNNQDGKRPTSITVRLLKEVGPEGFIENAKAFFNIQEKFYEEVASQVVSADNAGNWTYEFKDLPEYANGEKVVYSVIEDAVTDYTVEYDGYNIKNTHTPEKTQVTVTKSWNDENNQDGKRTATVTVSLMNGEIKVASVTLSESNNWSHTFKNLAKYENGNEIAYTVVEEAVAGYTPETTGTMTEGFTITNIHTPEVITISGEKTWADAENQDGVRPDSITVNLLANGKEVDSVTVKGETGWKYEFKDVDKYADGEEINYTVTEKAVDGYTTKITGFAITNTHQVEKTEVSGTKTWNDEDNAAGFRPESITVRLHANGEEVASQKVTPDADGNWAYSFTGLDKYAGGKEIAYTVTEDAVDKYTTTYEKENPLNIINSYEPEKTSVDVLKVWKDDYNRDGKRPDSITVTLLADGVESDKTLTLSESNQWKGTFDGLAKHKDGKEVEYTVSEKAVTDYVTAITGNAKIGYTITNTHEVAKTEVSGSKTWDDANNQDGIRPTSITVNLLANGELVDSRVVTATDSWAYSFTDLPLNKDGEAIKYTVTEDAVAGYDATVRGYNIINSRTPATTEIPVNKVWKDNDDQDGIRPDDITVKLLAGGVDTGKTVTLNKTNNWAGKFTDLAVNANGTPIVYTVKEVNVNGYDSNITGDAATGYTITNTHTPATVDVEGTKTWNDANNQDGIRPTNITVNLLADGKLVDSRTVVADKGNWTYSFKDLPEYQNGTKVVYSVEEAAVEGYDATVSGYNITNTHKPATTEVSITKTWVDNKNAYNTRPESITVNLYADNSTEPVKTATVKADNDWKYTFTDLPKYRDQGKEIVYSITENEVTNYATTINGYAITNTLDVKMDIPVAKVWDDKDDQDGKRPSVITVELYKEGKATGQTLTLEAADNWAADEFTGLAKYADGKVINYSVREVGEDNNKEISFDSTIYKVSHSVENGVYTITNSYTPETTEVSVEKVWADNNNQDGIRPNEITVQLKVGDDVKATQVLSETNNWKYTFEGLAKYAGGQEIAYTVDEVTVVGDYTKSISGDRTTGFIITNTHTPETTSVSGVKTWVDGNNADGLRPNEITVKLLADGKTYTSKTVTAKDGWKYTFDNLPVYENGQKVVYTIGEDAVKDYIGKTDGHNLINTIEQDYKHISVVKTWENAPVDADGKQILPEAITLVVTQDGAQYGEKITVTEADGWKATVANLPKYDVDGDGHKYKYAMYEEALPGYVPTYKLSKVEGKEQYVLEITNTYIDNNNVVDVAVEKVWQTNAAEVPTITINLMQGVNGADGIVWKEVAEQQLTNGNTSYKFVNQPKYYEDSEGNKWNYVYKVTEDPVKGYTTNITGDMKDGFTIYNTANDIGQLVVSKTATGDNKPAADTKYDFVLLIDAGTVDVDLLAKQNGMRAEANELAEAAEAAKAALQLAEENFVNTTFITTASEYQFIFYDDNHRALYGFGRTTPGVYDFHSHDHGFVVGTDHEQQNLLKTLIDSIVDAIKSVFAQMGSFFDIPEFMDLLKDEVEERNINTTPSALAFHFGSTVKFMEASREAELANSRAELALEAVDEFKITTPSAISVTFGKNTLDLTPDEKDDYFNDESKYYVVPFSLASGESLGFEIETANIAKGKSASIQYMVVEQNSYQNNLENTTITVNDNDGERKLDNNMTGWTKLSTGSAYSYAFLNAYSNNTTPPPPGDPEPPTPPTIPDPPTPPTPPEEIEVVDIPDEDVPLAEPGIEIVEEPIEEPDIPMGDAPPTGDTANAVPFVCLLLVGLIGFLVSRTKFN